MAAWLGLIVLIAFSAFFSSAETALMASGRVKLTHQLEQGRRGAAQALRLIEQPGPVLATVLVGNNLVNVAAAAIATVLWGPVWATFIITLLLLVLAEVTPKRLAASMPEDWARFVSMPVRVVGWVLKPVAWGVTRVTDLLLKVIPTPGGIRKRGLSRQEFVTALNIGARDGELEPAETRMARELLALKDLKVREIMVPIESVVTVDEGSSWEELLELIARFGHTRYPVHRGDPSAPIGMLLAKDLLEHVRQPPENWRRLVRELKRVSASLEADELLRDMQIQRIHLAAVEDAEGLVQGIVTMEDILEEVVGEIEDELDEPEGSVREVSPGRYFVDGTLEVDDLCKVTNIDLGH
ncbi:MAG: hemolysin family protein, partial [Polyangia bacterium]|nr:hemolysin family protein [Polyangia bacterium]